MDLYTDRNYHLRLSFYEVNLLIGNLENQDKAGFIARLTDLRLHADDPILLQELDSLNEKILGLSEAEFEILKQDFSKGEVLFPPNYMLPKLSD